MYHCLRSNIFHGPELSFEKCILYGIDGISETFKNVILADNEKTKIEDESIKFIIEIVR